MVAIDPHAGNDRGPQEIDGYADEAPSDHEVFLPTGRAAVGDRVRHVREFPIAAGDDVSGEIDVLYIDGAHRYAPALADIRNWGACGGGGAMLIHDSFSSVGVTAAILRELLFGSRFRYVGRSDRSTNTTPASNRVAIPARNVGWQVAQLPWFVRNVAFKALLTLHLGRLLGRRPAECPSGRTDGTLRRLRLRVRPRAGLHGRR